MRHRHAGAGLWSTLLLLALLSSAVYTGLKVAPLYFNEWRLERALSEVAKQPELALDRGALNDALQRRWDIDDIKHLAPADVATSTRALRSELIYDYAASTALTDTVTIQIRFAGAVPFAAPNGSVD